MNNLTDRDQQLAREYIILQYALKAFEHDLQAMKYKSALKLSDVFIAQIEEVQKRVDDRLEALRRAFIRVNVTDVPGVFEVKVGNREGDILLGNMDILFEIEKMFER